MANHLFYIKNTVDERNTCINGYFSTLDKAKEALKDCCDWYRSKGTGRIYRVDMDTLDPDSILVCTDGIIEPEFKQEYEPSSKRSFIDDLMDGKASFSDIDRYVEYWHTHNTGDSLQDFLGLTDDEFEEWAKSSDDVFKNFANQRNIDNFEKKNTKDLNSLIAAAKSISDQSAQLTSDLQQHKSSLERE